jgi:hypothetical protein
MSGNFQRLGDLATIEEHDFGEVWRAFFIGLPVADFDDMTAAVNFVRRTAGVFPDWCGDAAASAHSSIPLSRGLAVDP